MTKNSFLLEVTFNVNNEVLSAKVLGLIGDFLPDHLYRYKNVEVQEWNLVELQH